MTPQELDLLAAVLPRCDRATLAFCLASEPAAETSWLSIWSSIGKTFQQCRQRLENLPDCEIKIEILPRESGKTASRRIPRWPRWKMAGHCQFTHWSASLRHGAKRLEFKLQLAPPQTG